MQKKYFLNKYKPVDQVTVRNGNYSIEVRGENARLITLACVFTIVCIGVAALSK